MKYTVFEPKPLIRFFESGVEEIIRLKKKLQMKIDDLEDMSRASDMGNKKKLIEITSTFEATRKSFGSLEKRLADVGKTAIQIGEQLETVDKQRAKAVEAQELLSLFSDVKQGSYIKLDNLQFGSLEDIFNCAIIVKRLCAICRGVDLPNIEAVREPMEKYSEELERNLLSQFDSAYKKHDRTKMNHFAKTLLEFNGGLSCIQMYINQNEFFMQGLPDLEYLDENAAAAWKSVNLVQTNPIIPLCKSIEETIRKEWHVIAQVFPNRAVVMKKFIQRIFAQTIQIQLEAVLAKAESQSALSYLRVLYFSHKEIARLVSEIHKFDENVISKTTGEPILTNIVNRSFNDLFVSLIENDRYLKTEKKCLTDMFDALLTSFNNYVIQRAKSRKRTTAAAGAQLEIKNIVAANTMLHQFDSTAVNFGRSVIDEFPSAAIADAVPLQESLGLPTIDVMMKVLAIHVEAVNRCRQLSYPLDMQKNSGQLFKILIEICGRRYIEAAAELFLEDYSVLDFGKTEPTFCQLAVIHVGNRLMQLIQMHFQHILVPIVNGSATVHRECVAFKNEFMTAMEVKLDLLARNQVIHILSWLEVTLSKQKKTDYRPKEDQMGDTETGITETCNQICLFLRKVNNQCRAFLDGVNLDSMFYEVGDELCIMLLDHIKKFTVNYAGGLILNKDLSQYQGAVKAFRVPSLYERFDFLRELGNIYVVKPENLKVILSDGLLGKTDLALLRPFVSLREKSATSRR